MLDFNGAGGPPQGRIDAAALKARIDPRSFVNWLFSGRAICGKTEARIGSIEGEAGESLAVNLANGLWIDHATDQGGDLISLYMAHMGYRDHEFGRALREIASEFLGDNIPHDKPFKVREHLEEKKAKLGDRPKEDNLRLGAPVANYGYYDRDNKVMCVVRRYEQADGGKTFRCSPGFPNPRPLYRIPQIIQATHVVLVEGEGKADALAELGIEATSVLGGANTKLAMVDWTPIAGKHVIVWPDKDPAGEGLAKRVTPILLSLGCTVRMVTPPNDKPLKWDAKDCISEGGDPVAILRGATAVETSPLRVKTLPELWAMPATSWVIRNWLPTNALGFVYGDPGCGKTFLAVDWAMHITHGCGDWHGEKILTPGPIFYITMENVRGLGDRTLAWQRHHGMVSIPDGFEYLDETVSFLNPDDLAKVEATIRARRLEYRLIIVDTVSRVLPGADENLQKEMTLFISACDRLRAVCGATIIGAHHANRSGDMRGSTVLRGAGDFVFKLEKEGEGAITANPVTVKCEKLKDEEDGWRRLLKLEKVKLEDRADTDFNPVKTSLVISELMTGEPTGSGRAQIAVLKVLTLAGHPMARGELLEATNLSKSSLHKALNKLVEERRVSEFTVGGQKKWAVNSGF